MGPVVQVGWVPKTTAADRKRTALRLGNALRSLRRAKGLTQDELASLSSVHVTSIRDYEQGRAAPTWHTLAQIAAGLGISMTEIGHAYDRSTARGEPPKMGRPAGTRATPTA